MIINYSSICEHREVNVEYKTCSKCKQEKPATREYFYKWANGITPRCQECIKEDIRQYRKANPEKKKAENKRWREANPEYTEQYYKANREIERERNKRWRNTNPEIVRERNKRWREANSEIVRERNKQYRRVNPEYDKQYKKENAEKVKEYEKQYRKANPEMFREKAKRWREANPERAREVKKRYRRANPLVRVAENLRKRVRNVLMGISKAAPTMELIGCTIEELRHHLESQFTDGMTWDNYGYRGWHVDHIIPCSAFDLTDPEQQKECFNYTNLQPLFAEDNIRKGAKILREG